VTSRYESLVIDSIPAGCKRALDVGCGNGGLTRALRDRGIADVTGLDRDEPCIERCRSHPAAAGISYQVGDLLAQPLEPGSFDLVSAVASVHHVAARAGLTRLRELVAPGGVLVVIGLARPDLPRDIPVELAAQLVRPFLPRPGSTDGTPKPPIVWPPPERYATMRRLAAELLPGVRYTRHLLWRYSLVWTR
jgi:2-polyprenyl-3-methyl-5-hydroxy-6-metoxy-1,4-benzoquinol methylase